MNGTIKTAGLYFTRCAHAYCLFYLLSHCRHVSSLTQENRFERLVDEALKSAFAKDFGGTDQQVHFCRAKNNNTHESVGARRHNQYQPETDSVASVSLVSQTTITCASVKQLVNTIGLAGSGDILKIAY